MQGVLGELSRRLGYGAVQPLPLQAFDLEQQWEAAFRLLQSGGNIGQGGDPHLGPGRRGLGRRPAADGRHGRARAAHGALAGGSRAARRHSCWRRAAARWRAAALPSGRCWARAARTCASRGATRPILRRCGGCWRCQRSAAGPRLCGVWHAAGVLSDALLARQTAATLARVYGPKAHGAWALQRGTAALPLEACALFSRCGALGMGQVAPIGSHGIWTGWTLALASPA